MKQILKNYFNLISKIFIQYITTNLNYSIYSNLLDKISQYYQGIIFTTCYYAK